MTDHIQIDTLLNHRGMLNGLQIFASSRRPVALIWDFSHKLEKSADPACASSGQGYEPRPQPHANSAASVVYRLSLACFVFEISGGGGYPPVGTKVARTPVSARARTSTAFFLGGGGCLTL